MDPNIKRIGVYKSAGASHISEATVVPFPSCPAALLPLLPCLLVSLLDSSSPLCCLCQGHRDACPEAK